MPYETARLVWALLNTAGLAIACALAWILAAERAPETSALLITLMLVGSESAVASGNVSTLAIGLCVIAVFCFVQSRYVIAGVFCLAISMMLKPQDAGIIWSCFLFCGGLFRRRALESLLVASGLAIPSVLWVVCVAPQWSQEIRQNLTVYTVVGGLNDPGPTSGATHGSLVNLQVLASYVWNNPTFYNGATFLVCGTLVLILTIAVARTRPIGTGLLVAMAASAAFTLLIVYHRRYDTKLLLLAVPACAELLSKGGRIGTAALAITGACVVFTGDSAWVFAAQVLAGLHLSHDGTLFKCLEGIFVLFPAPISLLALGVFYLWVLLRQSRRTDQVANMELEPETSAI